MENFTFCVCFTDNFAKNPPFSEKSIYLQLGEYLCNTPKNILEQQSKTFQTKKLQATVEFKKKSKQKCANFVAPCELKFNCHSNHSEYHNSVFSSKAQNGQGTNRTLF